MLLILNALLICRERPGPIQLQPLPEVNFMYRASKASTDCMVHSLRHQGMLYRLITHHHPCSISLIPPCMHISWRSRLVLVRSTLFPASCTGITSHWYINLCNQSSTNAVACKVEVHVYVQSGIHM